jgi:3-hydroxyisobutyrate dehydrogenase
VKVAFIGMGTMGAPMALNLLKAGYPVTVHNRTREKEAAAAAAGAQRAASPVEAARAAEIIITCVSDTPDVERIILGGNGVIQGARAGSLVIDMSTISPSVTREIAAALAEKEIHMIDAPVSGGSEGARQGTLSIMVGGAEDDVAAAQGVLKAMGATISHVGPIGSGQLTKAINQIVLAGTYWSVAEGIALGLKAGLDMESVVNAMGGGAAGSWVMANRSGNMIRNEYPLGFKVELHRKDLNIALGVARELGVPLPMTAFVEQVETGLIARGYAEEDISAIARTVREQAGIDEGKDRQD